VYLDYGIGQERQTRAVQLEKMRGTPWQHVGRHVHDHRIFSSCAPEMDWPYTHTFSPHTSRG
jgi:hypothetical protein